MADKQIFNALSDDAIFLLKKAYANKIKPCIVRIKMNGRITLSIGGENLIDHQDGSSEDRWHNAFLALLSAGLIESTKAGGSIFEMTNKGYQMIDLLPE